MPIWLKISILTLFTLCSCRENFKLGNLEWATQDVSVSHFRNGDSIPYVSDSIQWQNTYTPAWTYYRNDSVHYGGEKLYNWYAVSDPRGICPKGWRVAGFKDWELLIKEKGGEKMAARFLKGRIGWSGEFPQHNERNGFNIYPSGNRKPNGVYNGWSISAPFWTSDEVNKDSAIAVYVNAAHDKFLNNRGDKRNALICRCVKDL